MTTIKDILITYTTDDTLLSYIETILTEGGTRSDLTEALTVALDEVELSPETLDQLLSLATILDDSDITTLENPIRVPEDKKKSKRIDWGNTYDVVMGDSMACMVDIDERTSEMTIDEYLADTYHDDPKVRLARLRSLCPCHVKDDVDMFWNRIIEMVDDEDGICSYVYLC